MSFMGDWAARWLRDEENEAVDEDYADVRQGKRAQQVADAVADAAGVAEAKMSVEEATVVSTAFWKYADIAAVKFGGPEYATSDEEKEMLVGATIPVCIEYLPAGAGLDGLKDLIPIELVLLGVVGIIYWPKYLLAKAAAKAKKDQAAGNAPEKEVHGEVTARGIRAVS